MDLNRAATFIRVVEAGSFTAAAAALRLPTSSVSRSIAKLEQELGVTLLERTTRKVSLTHTGRAYFERAREAVVALEDAVAVAVDAAHEPHGSVRLAAPPDLAFHIADAVAAFAQRYPRIHIDVTFTARVRELLSDGIDIAIVAGRLADSSLIVRKIGTTSERLFAAPSYLDARGRPERVADLARHSCIVYAGAETDTVWELVGPRGTESVGVRGQVRGDQMVFLHQVAVAGMGITLLPAFATHQAVKDGTLEPVLPEYAAFGALQSLVLPSRHLPHRVTLFRDYLTDKLATLECTASTKHLRSMPDASRSHP